MRMRKALVGVAAVLVTVAVVLLAAVGADFGTSIYAEYRLARVVRGKSSSANAVILRSRSDAMRSGARCGCM